MIEKKGLSEVVGYREMLSQQIEYPTKVEEFDLAHVLSPPTEEAVSANQDVTVHGKPGRWYHNFS